MPLLLGVPVQPLTPSSLRIGTRGEFDQAPHFVLSAQAIAMHARDDFCGGGEWVGECNRTAEALDLVLSGRRRAPRVR